MKKLTRAMQLRLEAVKQSRQRSNFTAAAISEFIVGLNFDVLYQMLNEIIRGTELVFTGFLTALIVYFVPIA